MQGIRNSYRDACSKMGVPMTKSLLLRFIELEAVMLAPIVPHWSDNLWRFTLHKTASLWKNSWPAMQPVDAVLSRSNDFVKKNLRLLREFINKKPKKLPANWHRPNKLFVYCAREYHPWQQFALSVLRECYDPATKTLAPNALAVVKERVASSEEFKKQMKDVLAFASFTVKTDFPQLGEDAFTLEMPFDEKEVMEACRAYILNDCQLADLTVFHAEDPSVPDPMNRKKDAKPGKPAFCCFYEENWRVCWRKQGNGDGGDGGDGGASCGFASDPGSQRLASAAPASADRCPASATSSLARSAAPPPRVWYSLGTPRAQTPAFAWVPRSCRSSPPVRAPSPSTAWRWASVDRSEARSRRKRCFPSLSRASPIYTASTHRENAVRSAARSVRLCELGNQLDRFVVAMNRFLIPPFASMLHTAL